MRSKRLVTDYLHDMLAYAEKAERFVAGLDFEDFQEAEQTVVLRFC